MRSFGNGLGQAIGGGLASAMILPLASIFMPGLNFQQMPTGMPMAQNVRRCLPPQQYAYVPQYAYTNNGVKYDANTGEVIQ